MSLDLAPLILEPDRAVGVGLVLTELIINANKYAYDGGPGPIEIALEPLPGAFRLVVADRGRGKQGPSAGFGGKMMGAMVRQLGGEIEYRNNRPGLRAVLTAPAMTPPG